jgi:hypothetical protein
MAMKLRLPFRITRKRIAAASGLLAFVLVVFAIASFVWRSGNVVSSPKETKGVPRPVVPLTFVTLAYDGKLNEGWQDWGWGPHELGKGPAKIGFGAYGGVILWHEPISTPFGAFSFRYKAPAKFGQFLSVHLRHAQVPEAAFPSVALKSHHVANLPDGFSEVLVDWRELNPSKKPFDRVFIFASASVGAEPVLIDRIGFTKERPAATPSARLKPRRNVELSVLCGEPSQPINPLIYGFSMAGWDTFGTANRIGGNPISRLNWDAGDLWNTGADWYFENHKQATALPKWIDDAVERDRKTALVVPLIGWVAKDGTSSGFPRSKFGQQRAHDPYRPEAGDGVRPDGSPIAPGPPTETSIPAPPELIGKWIAKLVERDRARGKRGVDIYILDNEPSLWDVTHRDVRPEPLGYDELLDRTLRYGAAIRAADPGGLIAGPAEWGWPAYFDSAKDRDKSALFKTDKLAHANVDLVPWYLRRLREHEEKSGTRILDMLDLHYYPQADGIYQGTKGRTDPEAAALRIRSTRSLWDPTYEDESWIKDRVELVPRMRRWVAENYPGRKTVIGEWSFGADEHISGALATLEALGRFGQHGLDAAFYWGELTPKMKTFWSFRAFRNFDGKGARFLDHSVKTKEEELVSLFASRDEKNQRMVVIISNKDANAPIAANVRLDQCGTVVKRRAFTFGADSDEIVEDAAPATLTPKLVETLPPHSFKILEIELSPPR